MEKVTRDYTCFISPIHLILKRKKLHWFGITIGILSLFPFLCLSFYNHPLGIHEWDWISNWHGINTGTSFWQEQIHWYHTNTGRFFSTAVLSFTDWWYSLSLFQCVFAFNILIILGLSYWLAAEFWPSLKWQWQFNIAILVVSLYLYQSAGIYDTFYSYSSVLTYSLGLWLTIVSAILLNKAMRPRKAKSLVIGGLYLSTVATIGANEISLITVNLIVLSIFFLRLYRRQTIPSWYSFFLLVIFASDLLAFAAPGNYHRMELYGGQPELLSTIFWVSASSLWLWIDWLGDGLLLLFILLWLPLGWQCRKQKNTLFDHPMSWFLFTVLIVPIALFPVLFGTFNTSLPERVVDLLFFTICWSSLGFCQSILNKYKLEKSFSFYNHLTWIILAFFFSAQLFLSGIRIDREKKESSDKWDLISVQSNIGKAYKTLLDQSALRYDQAMRLQYSELSTCRESICKVKAPINPPSALYEALPDRRTQTGDPFMGSFFRKGIKLVIYE